MSVSWSPEYEPEPEPPPYYPEYGRGITECTDDCYISVKTRRWEYEDDDEFKPAALRLVPGEARCVEVAHAEMLSAEMLSAQAPSARLATAEPKNEVKSAALDCMIAMQRLCMVSARHPEVRVPVQARLIERMGNHLRKVHGEPLPVEAATNPTKNGPQLSFV
jgi:hypothetical protein